MKKFIIILIAAALAGGGWYAYTHRKKNDRPRYR